MEVLLQAEKKEPEGRHQCVGSRGTSQKEKEGVLRD